MAFCEISIVRSITGVSEDRYADDEIMNFISMAQKEVTAKVQLKVIRELIEPIDNTRENDIDGVNTTYYFKNWKGNYLGDMDYDGDVDTDDIVVYQVDNNAVETILTVSSINSTNMSFTLSSAPNSVDLYVSYAYSPYNMSDCVDPLVSQATAYLASSYIDITDGGNDSIRFGNVSISGAGTSINNNRYYQKYQELMNQLIENSPYGAAVWGESYVQI